MMPIDQADQYARQMTQQERDKMNKKIGPRPHKHDPIEEAIEEALNNGELVKFMNEWVLRAALTLSRLFQHYGAGKIPKSIPVTEYAKYDPKYCKELTDTDELSAQSQHDIMTDLAGLRWAAFTFVGTDKKTGEKIAAEFLPFEYAIEMGNPITIEHLSKSESYKKYLNDYNDAVMVPTPPKRSIF